MTDAVYLDCERCNGEGEILVPDEEWVQWIDCPACGGTGSANTEEGGEA